MEMFVAWYTGDSEYQSIDVNCSVLVSLTNVSKKWTAQKWHFPPRKLIVASGRPEKRGHLGLTSIDQILSAQLKLTANLERDAFLCYPDFPLPRKIVSVAHAREMLEKNLKNADSYYAKFEAKRSEFPNFVPLGIIHGYDYDSLVNMAKQLRKIGYKHFALGSQEAKSRLDRGTIASFVETLLKVVGYLHILGVTSSDLFSGYLPTGIHSIDSATPVKEAFTNGIYFSNPIRRFKICTERLNVNWIQEWGYASLVCSPFFESSCGKLCKDVDEKFRERIVRYDSLPECGCPVCKKLGVVEGLLRVGSKKYNNRRALHNYFHMKKEFQLMLDNPFLERIASIDYVI